MGDAEYIALIGLFFGVLWTIATWNEENMKVRDCVGESEAIDFLDINVTDEPTEALARGIMVTKTGSALVGKFCITWLQISPSDDYNGTYRITIGVADNDG